MIHPPHRTAQSGPGGIPIVRDVSTKLILRDLFIAECSSRSPAEQVRPVVQAGLRIRHRCTYGDTTAISLTGNATAPGAVS